MASSTDGGVRALVDEEISSILAKFSGERRVPAAGRTIVESVKNERSNIPIPPNLICYVSFRRSRDSEANTIDSLHDTTETVGRHCFLAVFQAISVVF